MNIFQGDVLNLAYVKEAVKNQDVVLCALGDGKIGKIRAEGTKQIITALKILQQIDLFASQQLVPEIVIPI